MATSLYISNQRLMAVTGSANQRRIQVKAYQEAALPAGSVINGVITNEGAFCQGVQELAKQMGKGFTNVRIVLNASRIYTKRVVLPRLAKAKLMELVAGEFADLDTEADDGLIYDCMPLGAPSSMGQGRATLACAARASLVASYVELFNSLDVKLSGIDGAQSALIKLADTLPATKGETFITLGLDGNTLDASLFINGVFRHNNRNRLIADRGTPECIAEISKMVSSLIQFNASERSGAEIGNVYAIGLLPGESPLLNSIAAAYDVNATVLTDSSGLVSAPGEGFALDQYAYAVGNLIGA